MRVKSNSLLTILVGLALNFGLSASAFAQVPPGQSNLDLFVNAYHDQKTSYLSGTPWSTLQGQLLAEDHTGSVTANQGSDHYASAFGSVDAKQISLYSSARHVAWTDQGTYGVGGLANASASVFVPFLVQQSGLTGTQGTMVVPLYVTGDVTLDTGFSNPVTLAYTDGRAWVSFSATGLGPNSDCASVGTGGQCLDIVSDFQGTVVKGNGVAGTWILNIPFQFGSWNQYSLSMNTHVRVGGSAGWGQSVDHEGESDFSHTLSWGGISAILDASGNQVSGWSVQSVPGVDLATPVPEPGTWAQMLAGLCAVGWLVRRRRALNVEKH